VHSGEFTHTHQDLFILTKGLPIDITRTYKSQTAINTRFGYGWFMNYNIQLKKLANNNILIINGDDDSGTVLKGTGLNTRFAIIS